MTNHSTPSNVGKGGASQPTKGQNLVKGDDDFYTIQEIADYLGVKPSCVKRKMSQNSFPYYNPSQKLVYFKLAEVKMWIEAHRNASESELKREASNYLLNNAA